MTERLRISSSFTSSWYKEQDQPTYENPSVTADMVAYCFVEGRLKLLVIRRKTHPCQHRVALVGGFLQKHEDAIQACIREVQEEVGLEVDPSKGRATNDSLYSWSGPRVGSLSIAHFGLLPAVAVDMVRAGDDAKEVLFLDVDFKHGECSLDGRVLTAEDFAFDHYEIVQESIKRSKGAWPGIQPSSIS